MENDYGVPTAPIVTSRFADYVQRDGRSHGMNLRWSFPPYPVGFIPKEILRGYVDGNDPISGVPLMDEVIFALTAPLTKEEKHPKIVKRPLRPRLLEPDTEENLHRLFLESGWTDGLPIILPTEERMAEMRKSIPLGREGSKDDIGALALYLGSRASSYMTGNVIPLDGGVLAKT